MPWGSVLKPSLALAILKRCIQSAGYHPELHFLNIRFAEILGLRLYEQISDRSFFHPEWFFSQALFGPKGLDEIRNSWEDIASDPTARDLANLVKDMAGNSEDLCRKIADEYVAQFIRDCLANIDWGKYLAIGFTTTFAQSLSSLLLAKNVKEKYPHTKIIFGGANVDSEMGVEFLRGFPWIDYVVHGEAEHSFPALLNSIASDDLEQRIQGVSMRNNGILFPGDHDAKALVNLNDSPVPDYSDYIDALERAGFRKKINLRLYFESSRGCWWGAKHHCTFCGLNGTGMAFRKKDPDRVFSEIKELSESYRCLTFSATDNILAMDYFAQLLPKLRDMDADFNFFYEVKANLSFSHLKQLHAAGIREIQPGIESFNSRILRLMRKGVTALQNVQLLKWCYEVGIEPLYNILFGFPGETPEDYTGLADTFRVLGHLRAPSNIQQVLFERFSPYHFEKEKFGLTLKPMELYRFVFPESRVNLERIAYYFDGEWQDRGADPQNYIRPALQAWEAWKKSWEQQEIFCYYDKGPNYIIIHDNRPRKTGGPAEHRRVCLDAPVAALYLFCNESRSVTAITEMMVEAFRDKVRQEDISAWLEHLVAQELMLQENDRYLALAVRRKPTRVCYAGRVTPELLAEQH